MSDFKIIFSGDTNFNVGFANNDNFKVDFGCTIGSISPPTDPYTGEYEVTPKTTTQKLETKDKSMADDVTVHPIPYHEVSNTDGTTIIIGG